MAIKYFQNKRGQDVIVPTAEGSTVVVKPNHFVIDNTGTYYSAISELSEVAQGTVVQANLVYTYDPFYFARIYNTTAKIDPAVENDANAPVTTVPGLDTQVIFNDGGSFGADSGMTYSKSTDALTLVGPLQSLNFFENVASGSLALGATALKRDDFGDHNLSIGKDSMSAISNTPKWNIAIGTDTLKSADNAQENVAIGYQSMRNATSAAQNIGIGYAVMYSVSTGSGNVVLGHKTGQWLDDGNYNTLLGYSAGFNMNKALTSGSHNVFIGSNSGLYLSGPPPVTQRSYGIAIGNNAEIGGDNAIAMGRYTTAREANSIAIGYNVQNATANTAIIGNSSVTDVYFGSTSGAARINALNVFEDTSFGNLAFGSTAGPRTVDVTMANNISIGRNAQNSIISGGGNNIGIGNNAGTNITTGDTNVAIGSNSLFSNSLGANNVAIGNAAAYYTLSGNNIAIGDSALYSGASSYNIALGAQAGYKTEGGHNIFVGDSAGYGDSMGGTVNGTENVAIGTYALTNYVGGSNNIAIGYYAASSLSTGTYNTAIGVTTSVGTNLSNATAIGYNASATTSNTMVLGNASVTDVYLGSTSSAAKLRALNVFEDAVTKNNFALGSTAMLPAQRTVVSYSTAIGIQAMGNIGNNSNNNVAIGYFTLRNSSGVRNVAIGNNCMESAGTTADNVALGYQALYANVDSDRNIAIGSSALYQSANTQDNIAIGYQTLYDSGTKSENIAIGNWAGSNISTGGSNILIGSEAGRRSGASPSTANTVTTGTSNIIIGTRAGFNSSTQRSNTVVIGSGAYVNADNTIVLGNTSITDVLMGSTSGATVKAGKLTFSALNTAPASATSAGTAGEFRVTNTGIYICTVTGAEGAATWVKASVATF